MGTVEARINSWKLGEVRGGPQVNLNVAVKRYNKGLRLFQKYLLEYASGLLNTSVRFNNIEAGKDEYSLPLGINNVQDFYSIIQLRVAYHKDKNDNPIYRVCKPIDFGEYNIRPLKNSLEQIGEDEDNNPIYQVKGRGGSQAGAPYIWEKISELHPRYVFIDKNHIKIFPTPLFDIDMGLTLTYNFIEKEVAYNTDEGDLNLPRYFFDVIEDYLSYQLYLKENPELAQVYLETFNTTLHDNICGLNRDQRASEEEFANLSYFYKG